MPENQPSRNTDDHSKSIKEVGGFELISKLGKGAMGAVFKARQKSLDRIVALKILPPSIAKDTKFIERFQREARASAKLNHPNVVQGIDAGFDSTVNLWYFAMEYIDGPTVQQLLKEQRLLPEKRALEICRDIARALECAVVNEIVHRDIKPDNILLTRHGEAKLADLGLAKHVSDDASLTQSGQSVGTPLYMAPEQARGQTELFDVRTDIYALGGTLFHLVTGHPPFEGTTSAVIMTMHLVEPPPKANKINPAVSENCTRLITKMMQKKREQRVQTPTELIEQIDKILNGEVSDAATSRRVERHSTTGKRAPVKHSTPTGALLAAGGLLVVLGILAYFFLNQSPAHDNAPVVAQHDPVPQPAPAPTPPAVKPLLPPVAPPAPLVKNEAAKTPAPDNDPKKTDIEPKTATTDPKNVEASSHPDSENKEKPAPPADASTVAEVKPAPASTPEKSSTQGKVKPADTASARKWGGFKAEYFEGQNFDTTAQEQQEPQIDFRWAKGLPPGVETGGGASARWSGFIEPPETGDYTFEIAGGIGARLYLDDWLFFDSWNGKGMTGKTIPIPLDKGKKYAMRLETHSKGSDAAALSIKLKSAGDPVPLNAEPPDTASAGLPIGHLKGGWHAEYGIWGSSEPLVKRTEAMIAWDWGSGSPAPKIPVDKFWSHWTGIVVPPETDDYVFHVEADDGARLYIDDMLVLDAMNIPSKKYDTPPLHLQQGKRYSIKLEHIERADYASCFLRWSNNSFKDVVVLADGTGPSDNALASAGFLAEYGKLSKDAPKALLTRREIQPGWDWHSGSPAPEIPDDKFWANYSGWITPPSDGDYTFSIYADNGARVFIDDVMIFDSGQVMEDKTFEVGPVSLKGGKHYALRIEYWEWDDYAKLSVLWHSNTMPSQKLAGLVPDAVRPDSPQVGHLDEGIFAEYGLVGTKASLLARLEARLIHNFHSDGPVPELNSSVSFWGRWTGGLRVPANGNYAFKLDAEGSGEMHLSGVPLLKVPVTTGKPVGKAKESASARSVTFAETQPIPLKQGQIYVLELTFGSRRGEYSWFKLTWKPPGKTEYEDIPPEAFVLPARAREGVKHANAQK